uniref:SAM domain-containing protein n=1 Tax=Strigamia maritima TaxID=126957 RepID=T1J001_STRMM
MASAASDSEGPSNTSTITNEKPRRLKSPRENLVLRRSREGRSVSRERKAESLAIMSPFDENEEWAKIADIIASCGVTQGEWPMSKEIEEKLVARIESTIPIPQAPDPSMSAVGKWLDQIEVPEYEDLLLANGFDHLDFVGGQMLEEQELFEIGILNAEHRSRIVQSACTLPEVVPIESTKIPGSVDEWLDSLYLGRYKDTFKRHNYCDMDRVRGIWEVELTTILEITLLGHKKRIIASLGERPLPPNSYENISDLNTGLKHLKSKISQLNMVSSTVCETGPNGTLKGGSKVNTRKGPAPQPPNGRMSTIDTNGNKESDGCMEPICIRSPSQLFTGIPSALTTQWRHKPEVLVAQCCNYTAQYLGSTLVRELKGVETTRKAIQKLKNIVCEHEIRNIHCACQDADDLNHFAYITKDLQSDNHYCHVFSVVTMDMATEVILTLGQAFEVAYQLALRDKGLNTLPSRSGVMENGVERGDKRTTTKTLPSPDTRQQAVT